MIYGGGACIAGLWDPVSWVFIGLLRGNDIQMDEIGIWQLSARSAWFDIDIEEGVIEGESEVAAFVTFNSAGLQIGMDLSADIIINHNGRGESVVVPITLHVVDPRDIDTGGSKSDSPMKFMLNEPYPNPFNDTSVISFTLPEACQIRLALYSSDGRIIKTFLSGWIETGRQQITIAGDGIPSGTYVIKLESGSMSLMQKVVLMR